MKQIFDRLRAALPKAVFHAPATEQQIARVEKALQTPFPAWLRKLYLCCNGIHGGSFHDTYLYSLESNDNFPHSLLSWNQFNRNEFDQNLHEYEQNFPEVDWDTLHVRKLLIIGGVNGVDWAIDAKGGPEIIWFDVQNPDSREVFGRDLVDACVKNEQQNEAIREVLFRGREPLHRGPDSLPASSDIELVLETLIDLYRGTKKMPITIREATSPGWSLFRAISQREGEEGKLFILSRGASFEIQVATRDGNLPFILRAKVAIQNEPLLCLVKDLPETLLCALYLVDLNPWNKPDDVAAIRELAMQAKRVWRHRYGPDNPELERLAEVLFDRDDRRMEDDNRLGA